MTWADQLEQQEANLIEIKKEWEDGLNLTINTLQLIDEELFKLEKTRASIGERTYYNDRKTLLQLQEQNLEYKHGIFFIDPHGDAIKEITARNGFSTSMSELILDPEDPDVSFGINILSCEDVTKYDLRSDTFTRAKDGCRYDR